MENYTKQAKDFCEKTKTTIKVEESKRPKPPLWIKGDEDYGICYDVEVRRFISNNIESVWKFNFWGSIANKEMIEIAKVDAKLGNTNVLGKYLSFREHMVIKKDYKDGEYTPNEYDILACLTKYNPNSLEDFCSEFGYDLDSRKGLDTYLAVQKEWNKVEELFGDVLETLREIQ